MNIDRDAVLAKVQALPDSYWIEIFKKIEQGRQDQVDDLLSEFIFMFDTAREEILDLVENFYNKYSKNDMVDWNTGSVRLNRSELSELKNYLTNIETDLSVYGLKFDKDLEKRVKSVGMRTTRLEALKLKIECKLFYLYSVIGTDVTTHLRNVTDDFYSQTVYEVFRAAGYGTKNVSNLDEEVLAVILNLVWRSTEETYDDVIWRYGRTFIVQLNQVMGRGSFTAADMDYILEQANRLFGTKLNDINTLLRTDSTFFSTEGQRRAFDDLLIEEAVFTAILDERTSDMCREADGNVIPVEDITPWENAPPLHHNCRSTMIPVVKQIDWLTGEVYEIDNKGFDNWYDMYFDQTE